MIIYISLKSQKKLEKKLYLLSMFANLLISF